MGDVAQFGGITRSGISGLYTYTAIAGRENMPVNYVGFYDAVRFANWMNNGQGSGDTETGSYTLLGGGAFPTNGTTVARNDGATIVLTSENEWYKAAYFDPVTLSYFDYPAGSNAQTFCAHPSPASNRANCNDAVRDFTNIGSYLGSTSPYGTFDQGGNIEEWNEAIITNNPNGPARGIRGGGFEVDPIYMAASTRTLGDRPGVSGELSGFRLAMIPGGFVPEPGTGLLVIAGLLGLAVRRRVRA
jgi:formylglycine-generating enzyme